MRTQNEMLKQIARLGLILTIGTAMNAFSETMSWKEEVLLHDGNKIIAKRFYNLGGYSGFDSHERTPLDETVTFNLPNAKSVIWKNDFRDANPEPNSLNLIRFDIVNGIPYIATYPAGCIAYNKWGRPNPPQVLFKYDSNEWQRINLVELPLVLINTHANVIVGRPAASLLKYFYTVEAVEAKNAAISTLEYKTILRESVKGGDSVTSCLELVLYKGKWIMPNDPVMRAILDRQSK